MMPLTSPNDRLFINSSSTSCSGSLVRSAMACIPMPTQHNHTLRSRYSLALASPAHKLTHCLPSIDAKEDTPKE